MNADPERDHRSRFERQDWVWTREQLDRIATIISDLVVDHLISVTDRATFRPYPVEGASRLATEPLPQQGRSVADVLKRFVEQVEPWPFGNGSSRFFGWVNGPPDPIGVVAEALAAAMNPSVAGGNHAATHVERQVIRWIAELLGYPGDGLLVSGGSAATVHALAAARHRATGGAVRNTGLSGRSRLAVYASDQAHSCVQKAVELLGLGAEGLRQLPADTWFRLPPSALASAIAADRAAGVQPMAVVASAGTVNTGAIDPLNEIAEVCRQEQLWLHVDGAYGAPAVLDPRHAPQLHGFGGADSLAVDAHKWLYAPYEAGLLLVRDPENLRDCFSLVPPYLRGRDDDQTGVHGPPWFSEYGTQQTRGFRALKIWAALLHRGRTGYSAAVGHDLDLAALLRDQIRRHPDLELLAAGLSVTCFRYAPHHLPADRLDELNRRLVHALQVSGRAFCSATEVHGAFALRACIVNPKSTGDDIDALLSAVVDIGEQLANLPR